MDQINQNLRTLFRHLHQSHVDQTEDGDADDHDDDEEEEKENGDDEKDCKG